MCLDLYVNKGFISGKNTCYANETKSSLIDPDSHIGCPFIIYQ